MKQLTLTCNKCKANRIFIGAIVQEIIAAIDKSGWVDRPEDDKLESQRLTHCPDCKK